jgi:hypothetical protein
MSGTLPGTQPSAVGLLEPTQTELVHLRMAELRIARPMALKVTGISAMVVGGILPAWALAAGLFMGPVVSLLTGSNLGATVSAIFAAVGALIPPVVWIATLATLVVGAGVTVFAFVADAPRRQEYQRLKRHLRALELANPPPPTAATPF